MRFLLAFILGFSLVSSLVWATTHYDEAPGGGGYFDATTGQPSGNVDMNGNLLFDASDALELGTACTGGATGDVCAGAAVHVEGALICTADVEWVGATTLDGTVDGDLIVQNNAKSQGIKFDTSTTNGRLIITDEAGAAATLEVGSNLISGNLVQWGTKSKMKGTTDGNITMQMNAGTGVCWDVTADTIATLTASDCSAAGTLDVTGDVIVKGGTTKGSKTTFKTNPATLTFAANPGDASKVTTGTLIPDGVDLYALTGRVVTAGTNCTSIDIGDGSDVDLWGAGISVADATTFTAADATAIWQRPNLADQEVTITANGGNCFDLVVALTAHYSITTADTSD